MINPIDKAFQGTVVSQALSSLHEVSHEIKLKAPFSISLITNYASKSSKELIFQKEN